MQTNARDNSYVFYIMCSDEIRFINNGMLNRNNCRFGFNVWVGILGMETIGPILFDEPMTGQRYFDITRNNVGGYLEDLPFAKLRRLSAGWWSLSQLVK